MTDEMVKQILIIRDTGRTNMFDVNAVERIAMEYEFYELMTWIEMNKKAYCHFIMTGER